MKLLPCAAASVLGLTQPFVGWAQVPAGPEFIVNTATADASSGAAVATAADGSFVVVWHDYRITLPPPTITWLGIFGQRFDAAGARSGGEFRISTYTTFKQLAPAVAAGTKGGFVVSWDGDGADGDSYGILARRFDAAGGTLGSEFVANGYTTFLQGGSSLATDAAGNFVVTWTNFGQGGADLDVFARRFDSAGVPRGQDFRVNTDTAGEQRGARVATDAVGELVVVWQGTDGASYGVKGQRFDAAGAAMGPEFRVNSFTTGRQVPTSVAMDAHGDFVVVWSSEGQDGSDWGVFAQRFDASGTARGSEFRVNTSTQLFQGGGSVSSDQAGNFVIAWVDADGSGPGIQAQRFDASGARRGSEFRVNTTTTSIQTAPRVASDPVGNFVVAWSSFAQPTNVDVFGQRFGGLLPAALGVDTGAGGNRVLEPAETVDVRPSWRNTNGSSQTFGGTVVGFTGPPASGVIYQVPDGSAGYGTVGNGATAPCTDCYAVQIAFAGVRPSLHWDASLAERITPDSQGQHKLWLLHVGESFTDVPATNLFYRFVETLLHRGITGGCATAQYCPGASTTRAQMAVFVLVAKEGVGYVPVACGTPVFGDVPASSPFCRWIEELARRGVVSGCGGGNYCPQDAVTREQMAVFVLRTLDPALNPPACTTPVFNDVPASSPFCRWVEELARRAVVSGCGGGNYCPSQPVTREQMGVFIGLTFALTLYGP